MTARVRSTACVAFLTLASCGDPTTGETPSTSGGVGGSEGTNAGTGGVGVAGAAGAARGPTGSTVLRRLNRVELSNALSAVTAAPVTPDQLLPPDPQVQGFDTISSALETTPAVVEQLMQVAAATAASLDSESLGSCTAPSDERGCALERLTAFARHALRRPASPTELSSYGALYDDVRSRESAATAVSAVVERLLASPDFLYRVELGADAAGKLGEHELASRLAFTFWEAPPDAELSTLADRGGLSAVLPAQIERLLADARAKVVFARFLSGWLRTSDIESVTKDPAAYPDFAALKPQLTSELSGFVSALVAENAPVAAIVNAPYTLAGPELAAFYGVSHSGTGVVKITLPDRPGLLTRAGFLSTFGRARGSSPIRRGAFVRQRLLCLPLGVPPPGADALPPEAAATTTTRDFFANLTASPSCQGCHALLNPLGFSLEHYDGVGAFRAQENGVAVDAGADVSFGGDSTLHVNGAVELAAALAKEPQLLRCLATEWFRSRFGRVETGGDSAIIDAVTTSLGAGEHLLDAARALAQTPELGFAHFHREAP